MLTRKEIESGFLDQLQEFGELVRSLDDEKMATPSRCEGWTVGDVAAHVIGGIVDVSNGRLDGAGSAAWTNRQVEERRGRSPEELAAELEAIRPIGEQILESLDDDAWNGPAPAGLPGTLGQGVEALWYDAYLHGDDIRTAIGAERVGGPGLRASVHHVADILTREGWGDATLALGGVDEEVRIGDGGGRRIEGDALQFVLVATGRADPATMGLDPSVNIYK